MARRLSESVRRVEAEGMISEKVGVPLEEVREIVLLPPAAPG